MQLIIQALLVTTLLAGTFCQEVVFNNSTFISPCTAGARSGIDKFLITGNIGDNITMLLQQQWQAAVYIKKLGRTSSRYYPICVLFIRGAKCTPTSSTSSLECECFYNTTTDQVRFTLSDTVHTNDQGGIINAVWQHGNGTNIYSNKNYTFQDIYDVNAAQLNLTIAGATGNLPSGSCSFSLTLNKSNDLKLCCFNTAKPCYPHISFSGAVVTNNTEVCVTYSTSHLASDGVTENLALSYSVCNRTYNIQGSRCTVIPKPATDVTTTTIESSSSSSNATESPAPWDDNKYKIILPAVIVSAVVVIIGVGIAVYCYKTQRISKAV